ncbi:MAG TPA: pyridoxal 5'-phosphate synthase glutaminase subunit PdxT [Patescibacteria group bacterium]
MVKNKIIGVLALQGDFLEHIKTLQKIGVTAKEVRLPKDLENIDGIIFPGGESTTMANLLDVFKLREPLKAKIQEGLPVWGTCAGMILLAKKLVQDRPEPLGLMDITVSRNAFGRQIDSFETELVIKGIEGKPMHTTFIRAPQITKVGKDVEVLSKLDDGTIVAVREKNMLVSSFHPELTMDIRLHKYFVGF